MKEDELREVVENSFVRAITNETVDPAKFFSAWFELYGQAFYFLFSRNLGVTNIQFSELLALLRAHVNLRETKSPLERPLFISPDDFIARIESLVGTFEAASPSLARLAQTLTNLSLPLLSRSLVIQPLYTSCAVFVPPHLQIDLALICGLSGYIHSCGHLIFLEESSEATAHGLIQTISNHLLKEPVRPGSKIRFSIFAKEEAERVQTRASRKLHRGLEGVKLFFDRSYLQEARLVDIPHLLEEHFEGTLISVSPWDRTASNRKIVSRNDVEKHRSIWLLLDRSVNKEIEAPGIFRFYICYDQRFRNENPFQVFGEDKPAWWSPTTLPHNLAGAMINVTRPYWPGAGSVQVAEPFSGTGTILFESVKYENIEIQCSDIEAITPLLVEDNLRFFSYGSRRLTRFRGELEALATVVDDLELPKYVSGEVHRRVRLAYKKAISLLDSISSFPDVMGIRFDRVDLKRISKCTFLERIAFYLALRTALRNASALARGSDDWLPAYGREVQSLTLRLTLLHEIRKREERPLLKLERIRVYEAEYSYGVCVGTDVLRSIRESGRLQSVVKVRDARDLPVDSFDIVITDPPYGFNTDEDLLSLAELYRQMIRVIIRALKDEGQLVLCLPDRSYTGRQTRGFTQRTYFTQELVVACGELGREIVSPSGLLPTPREVFKPPFYWEAEKALRRSILHFRIRKT